MKINDIIKGFKVIDSAEHEELGGVLWKLSHIKTGAQVVWLDNGEENKLFCVYFKTIPEDDTGVFHIIEHSVLCGSDNYPVKEPFLDLLKGSMNTFLNAMTFPDKTMYPVSSRNERDFLNLTGVYLDAVLFPRIYKNRGIFEQEGWHYELDENGAPSYKGVVFNEMKGAYSSVDEIVECELLRLLFPDNCYRFSSGGDPDAIPSLTYEDFLAAHRKYYHPSNSRTYLDGDIPLEQTLALIDSYYSRFEKADADHDIPLQVPVGSPETVKYYEIGKDEDETEKVQMALGKVMCDWREKKKIYALSVLSMYLTDSNAAPLKRAILGEGLAQDVWLSINNYTAQTYSVLRMRNTEYENREKIKETVKAVCERLIAEGLDRDELESNINQIEFMLKETEEPRGIERAIVSANSWLYGGQPEEYLISSDTIASLRAELSTDYFERLLAELLLDGEHTCELLVLPSKTEGDRKRAAEESRLNVAASSWTDADREAIAKANAELLAWQTQEDSPEALATLPVLSLGDIGEMSPETPTEIKDIDGYTFIDHAVAANGIIHAKMYFNIADIPLEKLCEISFLTSLFGELPTEDHALTDLKREIKKNIGRLDFSIRTYGISGDPSKCRISFVVSMSLLEKNLGAAVALVSEILKNTKFDDKEAIREILLQHQEDLYQSIIERGNKYAATRANRNFDAWVAAMEKLDGFDLYRMFADLSADFDSKADAFIELANDFVKRVFVRSRLTLAKTCTCACPELTEFAESLALGEAAPEYFAPELSGESVKEAIKIPAGISYAALGSNLYRHGAGFSGALNVLSSILSYGYLWSEIRVLGGAYGCGFGASNCGNLRFTSFRDPTPLRSLGIYKSTSEFIKKYAANDETIDKYIISTIAAGEPLRSVSGKGSEADTMYFCEQTYADKCALREEMLKLKKSDLLSLCGLFDAVGAQGSECIIAHEGVVAELDDSWTVYSL